MSGKRRPSGDGLIRKRSDGRWEGRIVVGHKNDGTPIYKSVFGKTQRELMPRLAKLKENKTCLAIRVHAERSYHRFSNTQAVSKCRSTRFAIPSQRKLSDTEWMLKRLLAR